MTNQPVMTYCSANAKVRHFGHILELFLKYPKNTTLWVTNDTLAQLRWLRAGGLGYIAPRSLGECLNYGQLFCQKTEQAVSNSPSAER